MTKISSEDPHVVNRSGTSLPVKRAQEQLSNEVGPSQVVSDKGQLDDDGGPPPAKRKHSSNSRTATADEVLDSSLPLKRTPARPRPRRQAPNAQKEVFEDGSKTPKTTPKDEPIPRSSRNRPAVTPTAASARSSRRTGPAPPPVFGDSIPISPGPISEERSASSHETTIRLEPSSRSAETIVKKPDLIAESAAKTTLAKLKSQTSNQSSNERDSFVSIYGGGDSGGGDDDGSSSHRSYWLMKAEPESRFEKGVDVKFSIDDLENAKEPEPWDGVRNFQARKCMEEMKKGDLAFFYHSNCKPPGIVGIMEIVQEHSIDQTANDPAHPYYDDRNQKTKNWVVVHVEFRAKFKHMVGLKQLQDHAAGGKPLADMQALRQKRLSVSRVSAEEWLFVLDLADAAAAAAVDLSERVEAR